LRECVFVALFRERSVGEESWMPKSLLCQRANSKKRTAVHPTLFSPLGLEAAL